MGTIYWSIIMYINSRQMCVLTFARQRKCGVFGTVIPSAGLCAVVVVSTVLLSTYIYMAQCVCDIMTSHGQSSSLMIVSKICAVSKNGMWH